MHKVKLQRQGLQVTSFSKEMKQFANKVSIELGYNKLAKVVQRPKLLAKALIKLDIKPFSEKSVREYKQWKLTQAQALLKKRGSRNKFISWLSKEIHNYQEPIPEFVLQKALEIKEEVPDATFRVEYMSVQSLPDPFLTATLGEEKYHIEVWNEPKFENDLIDGSIELAELLSDADRDEDDESASEASGEDEEEE